MIILNTYLPGFKQNVQIGCLKFITQLNWTKNIWMGVSVEDQSRVIEKNRFFTRNKNAYM